MPITTALDDKYCTFLLDLGKVMLSILCESGVSFVPKFRFSNIRNAIFNILMPFVNLNTFRNGLATCQKIYQLSMHAIILLFMDTRKECTKYET